MFVVAQRPVAAVLIGLASALLLTACGGKDRSAVLARYECSQIAAAMALANAAADEGDDLREKAMIDVQVGRLHVPGLRPVSIAAPSGAPLSWGAMTAPQRDTWSAWRALDDPRVIEVARTGNLFGTDPVSSCARDPLPPAPSDGLSSRKLADDVSPFNSATLEQAADRINERSSSCRTGFGRLPPAPLSRLPSRPRSRRFSTVRSAAASSAVAPVPGTGASAIVLLGRGGVSRWS